VPRRTEAAPSRAEAASRSGLQAWAAMRLDQTRDIRALASREGPPPEPRATRGTSRGPAYSGSALFQAAFRDGHVGRTSCVRWNDRSDPHRTRVPLTAKRRDPCRCAALRGQATTPGRWASNYSCCAVRVSRRRSVPGGRTLISTRPVPCGRSGLKSPSRDVSGGYRYRPGSPHSSVRLLAHRSTSSLAGAEPSPELTSPARGPVC
jgi:hypothetical protein